MNTRMIENKEHFKATICSKCKLCNSALYKANWCYSKFIENRNAFLARFIHVIISSRGKGLPMDYFRRECEFKKLFCDPDTGACITADSCQGAFKSCHNAFYNQVIGIPNNGWCCGSEWPTDEDEFNERVLALKAQHGKLGPVIDANYTVVKRDKEPFIFTSTGKRFLNRVEKILENRHKSEHRNPKSSTKTRTAVKREVDIAKPPLLRSEAGRKKDLGDSKRNKATGKGQE